VIRRYLQDIIAAEKSFETQLTDFAKEAAWPDARIAFATHARETSDQISRLTARLHELGGETSAMKSFMAHIFNMAPKSAQLGHVDEERTTQNLIIGYSVENAEVAMYAAFIVAAEAAGDADSAELARKIQAEEKETAGKVWKLIAPCAAEAFARVISKGDEKREQVMIRYLEDAEAAERNFEDALATFSRVGDQSDVQALLATMSRKAATQHERLEKRLRELGGGPSSSRNLLAHMLAFTPVSAQLGHTPSEKNTQHLMITFSAASAEMGMYESLAAAAEVAGDTETLRLARELQREEKEDHSLAWEHLERSAHEAVLTAH
jgi:ferritin-like metal-binding protein YciE